ncbi:5-oxoprolinase subunit PxpB [Ruoffia tabacinasalis]|uniref:5-oxoprolinase subunit PxpB n=1 Tax=Ruoffia tabacinasalis TaxID=87458 RepID=A0ABS0LLV8_9LACT|nr:5-oxoprolinase subunit PxpB [Ruoffia tabacinasalis]
MDYLEIKQYTEDSLTLLFGDVISPDINKKIVNLRKYIDSLKINGIIEMIISYTRLVIYFDPLTLNQNILIEILEQINLETIDNEEFPYRVVEIPVCYGGDFGPDLWRFEEKDLTVDDVIKRHTDNEYLVYMLGFMPGFVYLGGLDPEIAMDRLETPRTHIAAGSVGIAGQQTGVYPYDSPGGWNLIGRTPIQLYDTRRGEDTILYNAGDRIKFYSISNEEFNEIQKQVETGTYQVSVILKGVND